MSFFIDNIGADFELTPEGDLAIDSDGRLLYTQSEQTLRNSLIRRITTAPLGYARFVETEQYTGILNLDYGSEAIYKVGDSYPAVEDLGRIVEEAALKDGRVEEVEAFFVDGPNSSYRDSTVSLELVYTVKEEFSSIYSENITQFSLSLMF